MTRRLPLLLRATSGLLAAGCIRYPAEIPPFPDEFPIETTENVCAPAREDLVTCVIDGDTFDLSGCGGDAERVRMLGIQAPELARDGEPAECHGERARDVLRRELEGRRVLLEFDVRCEDDFGRTLAWVFTSDTEAFDDPDARLTNMNVWMIQNGHARVFREFEDDQVRFADQLERAEESARDSGLGLWDACGDP
jgi:micrococcal nuclease